MKINITLIALLAIFFISCSEDCIINNNAASSDNGKPMWPQWGYNARHTGNINALKTYMSPVNLGQHYWTYVFNGYIGDGSEITVDSKGNAYFLNQTLIYEAKLCKFSPEGNILWSFDTLQSNNYFGMALSSDEAKIYFTAYRNQNDYGLYCKDSSGKKLWQIGIGDLSTRPVIGKSNNIYCLTGAGLHRIDESGNILWVNTAISLYPRFGELAIDRDENIYVSGTGVTKVDKNGNILWTYLPYSSFYTQGAVIDANNNLYFTTHFNVNPYSLYSLNKDGTLRWRRDTNYTFVPTINNDNIIFCGGNGITSLDTTGNILWYQRTHNGTSFAQSESPVLDDESNIYYIVWDNKQAGSIDRYGNYRWGYDTSFSSATLPGPTLSPLGYLLFGPKRSARITSVK